jgi:hypothetical protein
MEHEKIKIGETTLDIANGSCGLDRAGNTATVAIIIGSTTIDDIHKALTSSSVITKYDRDGAEEWRKDNLIYTGKMNLRSDFPVGIEQRQTGVDEEGKPIYSNVEVMGDVVIVKYQTPTMQDEVKELKEQNKVLNAQITYLSMMSGVDVEGV